MWELKIFMLATSQKVERLDFFPTAHTDVLSKDVSLPLPGSLDQDTSGLSSSQSPWS